jgi:hypothetical protein
MVLSKMILARRLYLSQTAKKRLCQCSEYKEIQRNINLSSDLLLADQVASTLLSGTYFLEIDLLLPTPIQGRLSGSRNAGWMDWGRNQKGGPSNGGGNDRR